MFKPQFAPLVESGEKCQTVRPWPKRLPQVGDRISLRCWTGKPYRSKQRVLREARITEGVAVYIDSDGVNLYETDWSAGYAPNCGAFAVADGFSCWEEMRQWFEREHGLPFRGVLLVWQNTKQREKLGLTQAGLAALLEVTRETVNRRESGEQPITHEAALAIRSLRPAKPKAKK